MDAKTRIELIRRGNEFFNKGDIEKAAQIFKATNYRDGLIRVGDYFYFEKHQPLRAYGYYRQAGYDKGLEKIKLGFVFALKCWLWNEVKPTSDQKNPATEQKKEVKKTENPELRPPRLGDDYITPTKKKP